ncbi:MAG: hypothetical protein J6R62_04775, partial [Rikenellaceae bacterium]|nr:hypothetical protein [Rikenellaceae bacterium]
MTKKLFITLTLGFILSFLNVGNSHAQTFNAATGSWSSAPLMSEWIRQLKLHFESLTHEYYRTYYKEEIYLRSFIEFPVIQKGKSNRFKWLFDNKKIVHIEVEGVGATTPEDIEKGEFVVTVSPEQTTLYKVNIHKKRSDGSIIINRGIYNRRVIVVEDRRTLNKVLNNIWWKRNDKTPKGVAEL